MSVDWYERAVDDVIRASREVCDALQAFDRRLVEVRRQRAEGVPFIEMIERAMAQGYRDRRVAADEAIATYRNAVMQLRVAVVRGLVDSEGMTLTAAAKLMGISRQMASRLYRTAQPEVRGLKDG